MCAIGQCRTLLTAREVAARLNLSLRKFEQLVHDGTAPRYFKHGSVRRWDWTDVQDWIETRKVGGRQ